MQKTHPRSAYCGHAAAGLVYYAFELGRWWRDVALLRIAQGVAGFQDDQALRIGFTSLADVKEEIKEAAFPGPCHVVEIMEGQTRITHLLNRNHPPETPQATEALVNLVRRSLEGHDAKAVVHWNDHDTPRLVEVYGFALSRDLKCGSPAEPLVVVPPGEKGLSIQPSAKRVAQPELWSALPCFIINGRAYRTFKIVTWPQGQPPSKREFTAVAKGVCMYCNDRLLAFGVTCEPELYTLRGAVCGPASMTVRVDSGKLTIYKLKRHAEENSAPGRADLKAADLVRSALLGIGRRLQLLTAGQVTPGLVVMYSLDQINSP